MDALAQQAVGAGIQLSADHYLAAKQSNRELKDQQASTPHKVRKQAPGQHKPVHSVHGHEVMNDPALQIAKPSQNGLFGRSPSAPGTMYVPEPRLETEAIGYQLSEQNRARMQQHQASSSTASGSKRHLFAIPSLGKTGSLTDVAMHKPAGYTQQVVSDRYHLLDQQWQVRTRTLGALQAIGGGLEVSFGVELAATGVGAIPGALLVGSGIDNLGAGAHTFISGQSQQTTLEMVMTQNGVSAGNAATMQAGADFALNLGGAAAMHAPQLYQMGARWVSSIAEPVSQFAQRATHVIGEQIGAMHQMFPDRPGISYFVSKEQPLVLDDNLRKLSTEIRSLQEIAKNVRENLELNEFITNKNIVWRALTESDLISIKSGNGILSKAPQGTWSAAEHVANVGPGKGGAGSNSPWVSTTRRESVAQAYNNGNGYVQIDLDRVDSLYVEVWKHAQRLNGLAGLPYHRSIWSEEVTIFQSIPSSSIIRLKK